jgi:hypothetical protein
MTPEEMDDQKRVEYYASSVNAWFNSSLEHDKSLLTLSAGGIGLLITLLTTVGLTSAEALVLYIGAIASFVVTLIAILVVFRRNRTYIEQILSGKATTNDPLLTKLDVTALWAFGIGVIFTAIIGIAAAIHSYTSKEKTMTNDTTKKSEAVPLRESVNGASKLQPATDFTKSFNGAGNLQPQPAAGSTSSATSTSSSTPAPAGTSSPQKQGSTGK